MKIMVEGLDVDGKCVGMLVDHLDIVRIEYSETNNVVFISHPIDNGRFSRVYVSESDREDIINEILDYQL